MKKFIEQFGKHLIFSGYGIKKSKLDEAEIVFDFLDKMPGKIGMKKLTIPYVVIARPKRKKEWGISGFVMIYTSHISCHTWPEKGYVSIDVYSCKNFNEKKLLNYLKKFWSPKETKTKLILRD